MIFFFFIYYLLNILIFFSKIIYIKKMKQKEKQSSRKSFKNQITLLESWNIHLFLFFHIISWFILFYFIFPFSIGWSFIFFWIQSIFFFILFYFYLQIAKIRNIAITYGNKQPFINLRISSFLSSEDITKLIYEKFPEIKDKIILGLSEGTIEYDSGILIPLSKISELCIDYYSSIVYRIILKEDEYQNIHSFDEINLYNSFSNELTVQKKFLLEELQDEINGKNKRLLFCQQLKKKGYAIVSLQNQPNLIHQTNYLFEITEKFFSLPFYEKKKFSHSIGKWKDGYNFQGKREFIEKRILGNFFKKRAIKWPEKVNILQELLESIFFDYFKLSYFFLELLTEGMGLDKKIFSSYLETFPITNKECSASMYR